MSAGLVISGKALPGGDLTIRILSAVVLAVIAIGGALVGGLVTALVVAIGAAIVHLEWAAMTGDGRVRSAPFVAVVVAAVLATAIHSVGLGLAVAAAATIAAGFFARNVWMPAGVAYASAFGLGLMALRLAPDLGFTAIAFLFAVVWGTDSGAYFAGRAIGGPKLWPRVSPKKTWAGAVGGLATAVIAGLLVAQIAGIAISFGLIAVAIVLSIVGEIGDLLESAIKRRFGVKDSGNIIPGHGGLMDRVDALTVCAGLAALIGLVHGGPGDLARGLLQW